MKGYVQVYTGDGKGKTTAAMGLALRAAGAGLRVLIIQFMKARPSAEIRALEILSDDITIRRYGAGRFVRNKPSPKDIQAAREGLEDARRAMLSGRFDVVILDEVNVAMAMKVVAIQDVLDLLNARPAKVELVLTGRRAPKEIIDRSDLVTEMREVKHYFRRGVVARKGIEK